MILGTPPCASLGEQLPIPRGRASGCSGLPQLGVRRVLGFWWNSSSLSVGVPHIPLLLGGVAEHRALSSPFHPGRSWSGLVPDHEVLQQSPQPLCWSLVVSQLCFPPGQEQPHFQPCCVCVVGINPLPSGTESALYLGVRQGQGPARAIPNIFHPLLWER